MSEAFTLVVLALQRVFQISQQFGGPINHRLAVSLRQGCCNIGADMRGAKNGTR